jgi:Na+-driven multidrug efflux pump
MADFAEAVPAGGVAAGPAGTRPSYPFEVRSRDIFRIALPASVAFITEPLVGLVDITVIGRLGDAALLGGLVLGALVFDFIFSLAYFLRLGTAGLTAQAVGARDPRDGLMHVARAILVAIVAGLLLIAVSQPIFWLARAILAPALAGLFLLVRHYGGVGRLAALLVPAELFDGAALRRMFSLSRDITIRTALLMSSYVYFASVGSRVGEDVLSGNAILMNMLMIMAYFLDGLAQAAEQLSGKAVGANWRPAFDRAVNLSFGWGISIGLALTAVAWLAGPALIGLMTTSEPVRAVALAYLPLAALSGLTGMPAFVMDGVVSGATLNTVMRNGMLISFALFLLAALTLQPLWGNAGLWAAFHVFYVARGLILWLGTQWRKPRLFS